jgi:hypothetical protein
VPVLAVALLVLSVGTACCLFDGHSHEGSSHGVPFDFCLGIAVVAVAGAGFTSILIHPMPIERPLAVRVASLHTPAPPPKFPSRF